MNCLYEFRAPRSAEQALLLRRLQNSFTLGGRQIGHDEYRLRRAKMSYCLPHEMRNYFIRGATTELVYPYLSGFKLRG